MDRPSQEVLARMPLAEAVLLLWGQLTDEERLQSIWDQFRGRCYDQVISFPVMVQLIADALLQYEGSGRRSFEKGIENEQLQASVQAAYGKLRRLPIAVSQAFLASGSAALLEIFPTWAEWQLPKSLRSLRVQIVDGKAIKYVEKRLQPLRGVSGGLLGGRVLVNLDWHTGMAVAMHADADGDANDVRFTRDLVPAARQQVPGPRLWVGDSAYCDLEQPRHFTAEPGDHFLVRYHPKVKFHRDPKRPARTGTDDRGRRYEECWGWLGSERDSRRRAVRMIRVPLTQKKELVLITDLLDADLYPAQDLLWLYGERWGIEKVFQTITEVFSLQHLIGGTPEACLFQFAFCLVLYNLVQVVRGYLAQAQDCTLDHVSTEKVFDEMRRQLIAWNVLFPPVLTLRYFEHRLRHPALEKRLQQLLSSTWSEIWRKAPPQKRKPKTTTKRERTHNSVYRILQAKNPKKPP
jgi:hypothetical protein